MCWIAEYMQETHGNTDGILLDMKTWWRRRVKETIYIWIPYKFYKWGKASRNGVRNMYTITINDK